MKKVLFALLMCSLLTACTSSNVSEITENSSLPTKVVKATKDTTLKFNRQIISTDEYMYVLQKTPTEVVVEQRIQKEDDWGIILTIGFFLGMAVIIIIAKAAYGD